MKKPDTRCAKSTRCVRASLLRWLSLLLLVVACSSAFAQKPAASLSQIRNGRYDAPLSPANWVNGNVNQQQAHMVEGYSVPYRVVMTNMLIGETVTITLEYDTKHSCANAIDFITGYDNLEPHDIWGHPAEVINPVLEFPQYTMGSEAQIIIDAPTNEPTNGFFNNFMGDNPDLNYMSIWGATVDADAFNYVTEGPIGPDVCIASTSFSVTFTVTDETVVLAWGGHIATWQDWELVNETSAGGINGSPYHTRIITWDVPGGNLGNQDRSMQAAVVLRYFTCEFEVGSPVCINTQVTAQNLDYVDVPEIPNTYEWEIINQEGTNATPLTGTGPNFQFNTGSTGGTLTLVHTVSMPYGNGFISQECEQEVVVSSGPTCSITPLPEMDYCLNVTETFYAPEAPVGEIYTYEWSISGNASITGVLDGQSVSVLTGGLCGESFTLTLTITDEALCESTCSETYWVRDHVPPVIDPAPADITVQCIDDVPAMISLAWTDNCDLGGQVQGVDGPLVGDECGGTITRTWNIMDACGNAAITRTQIITVDDDTAPVLDPAPADITVQCIDDVPAMISLAWTDNCDLGGQVQGVDGPLVG
ncbi:MAG: hypothetical protein K0B15_04240, partial [Lentimicrobium sp.]|nr:hypothetical protein [Lentimicrobium sp.]